MKRVSDERLASLPRRFSSEDVSAVTKELQAWRAAFEGVKMVVPVEWVNVEMNILRTSSENVKLACTDCDGEDDLWCEQLFGVIRLDELTGPTDGE